MNRSKLCNSAESSHTGTTESIETDPESHVKIVVPKDVKLQISLDITIFPTSFMKKNLLVRKKELKF